MLITIYIYINKRKMNSDVVFSHAAVGIWAKMSVIFVDKSQEKTTGKFQGFGCHKFNSNYYLR